MIINSTKELYTIADYVQRSGKLEGWTPEQNLARLTLELCQRLQLVGSHLHLTPGIKPEFDDYLKDLARIAGSCLNSPEAMAGATLYDARGLHRNAVVASLERAVSDCFITLACMLSIMRDMTGATYDPLLAAFFKVSNPIAQRLEHDYQGDWSAFLEAMTQRDAFIMEYRTDWEAISKRIHQITDDTGEEA